MPTLDWPGQKTRWVVLVLTWIFACFALLIAVLPLSPTWTTEPNSSSVMWTRLVVGIVGLTVAVCATCYATYSTLVMLKAELRADENGISFRNVRSASTTIKWNDIERATSVTGGIDPWWGKRVLLLVLKDGTRHRVAAIPYLFNRGEIYIQQWVDFINFKCGGQELSGWQVHDDSRHLAPFSDLQTFKQAVNNEFLT